MYESKHQQPIEYKRFLFRLLKHIGLVFSLLFVSLIIGIFGHMFFEGLSFIDSLLASAMLLGGMGVVFAPHSMIGKIFVSFYALYAGLIFIVVVILVLTPVVHRLIHSFHANQKQT